MNGLFISKNNGHLTALVYALVICRPTVSMPSRKTGATVCKGNGHDIVFYFSGSVRKNGFLYIGSLPTGDCLVAGRHPTWHLRGGHGIMCQCEVEVFFQNQVLSGHKLRITWSFLVNVNVPS